MHGVTTPFFSVAFSLNATANLFLTELQKTYSPLFPPLVLLTVFVGLPLEYRARYEQILETMASSQHPVTANLGPVFKSIPPTSPHRVLCGVSSPELSELRANLKNKGFAEYLSDTPGLGKMVEYSSLPLVGRLSSIRAVEVASHVEEVVKTQEDGLGTLRIEGFWLRSKKSNGHVRDWETFPFDGSNGFQSGTGSQQARPIIYNLISQHTKLEVLNHCLSVFPNHHQLYQYMSHNLSIHRCHRPGSQYLNSSIGDLVGGRVMADNKRGKRKTQDQGFLELAAVEYCMICQTKVEELEEGIGSARRYHSKLSSTYLSST